MNEKIRAVGFDLGDTLLFYRDTPLSWESLYPAALERVAKACKATPTTQQVDEARKILARYNTRLVPRAHEVTAEESFTPILESWNRVAAPAELNAAIEAFFSFFQQQMCPFPETAEVLTSLRQVGLPVGILTDVPYGMPRRFVLADIERAGISKLFDALVTSTEVGARKPEKAGYLALASRLGVAPPEMIFVGNEPKDVIGANRAGMVSVFLDRNGSNEKHGQQFTITSLRGLRAIIGGNRRIAESGRS